MLRGRELGWVNLGACGADVSNHSAFVVLVGLTFSVKIMINATAIFWVSGGKSNREEISSGAAPEPRRRQEVTFSTEGGHYSTKPKSTLPNPPDSPVNTSHFTPSSSFPKYVDTDLERSDLLTQPSWIHRLFSKEKPRKERHLKVPASRLNICHR